MTKTEFVTRARKAVEVAKAKGAILNREAVIAQAALESGWGSSLLAAKYNNLFGIKRATDWTGPTVQLWTKEWERGVGGQYRYVSKLASWAVWPSWNECLVYYSKLIASRWWFADALPHADPPQGDGNAWLWIGKLVDADQAGELKWATSPTYLQSVMERVAYEVAVIQGEIHA